MTMTGLVYIALVAVVGGIIYSRLTSRTLDHYCKIEGHVWESHYDANDPDVITHWECRACGHTIGGTES